MNMFDMVLVFCVTKYAVKLQDWMQLIGKQALIYVFGKDIQSCLARNDQNSKTTLTNGVVSGNFFPAV